MKIKFWYYVGDAGLYNPVLRLYRLGNLIININLTIKMPRNNEKLQVKGQRR